MSAFEALRKPTNCHHLLWLKYTVMVTVMGGVVGGGGVNS